MEALAPQPRGNLGGSKDGKAQGGLQGQEVAWEMGETEATGI